MCHKTLSMTTRYGNHDIVDAPAPQASTMPRQDNESSGEYSEETEMHHPLAELQEQFWQLQEQFAHLELAHTTCTYGRVDTVYR